MDWTLLDCHEALARYGEFDAVIDVRSPSEFAEDHLPGAINLPVLDDAERAEVGLLYARSPFEARRLGAARVSGNIARHLVGPLAQQPRSWRPLVYCWRGGERSAGLAHVLERIGWPVRRLRGGYKAWRAMVLADFATLVPPLSLIVIGGATGSGKTALLHALAARGAQVLDLEGLARHRGSVLGGLPEAPQPSQKAFETALWSALRSLRTGQPVFVESESRKVGDVRLPDPLVAAMRAAPFVSVQAPLAARVALLRSDYAAYERDLARLESDLQALVPLHGRVVVDGWRELAQAGRWEAFVERLLVDHYDPAYARSLARNYQPSGAAQRPSTRLDLPALDAAALAAAADALMRPTAEAPA